MAVIEEILRKLQAGSLDLAEAFALAAADNANGEMPVLQEGSDLTVARLDRNIDYINKKCHLILLI